MRPGGHRVPGRAWESSHSQISGKAKAWPPWREPQRHPVGRVGTAAVCLARLALALLCASPALCMVTAHPSFVTCPRGCFQGGARF